MLRYTHWIGMAAAAALMASCFLPWAWYPDLQTSFTGFFSYQNYYGRPGKFLVNASAVSAFLFLLTGLLPRKTGIAFKLVVVIANIIIALITFSFAIKNFITYSRCYSAAICPKQLPGIFIMISSAALLLVMSLLPHVPMQPSSADK